MFPLGILFLIFDSPITADTFRSQALRFAQLTAGAAERAPVHQGELGLGVNQEQLCQNHKEAKNPRKLAVNRQLRSAQECLLHFQKPDAPLY